MFALKECFVLEADGDTSGLDEDEPRAPCLFMVEVQGQIGNPIIWFSPSWPVSSSLIPQHLKFD